MKKDYFTLNKNQILTLFEHNEYFSIEEIKVILHSLKEQSLISNSLSLDSFLLKLIDEGLIQKSINIRGHLKTRYTFNKTFNVLDFCNSLSKNTFFSMTTTLNIQGLTDFRNNYIFVSKERTKRVEQRSINLIQENIDNAFKKKPKRTTAHDKIENYNIILLEANNTNSFEIIKYNGYKISSINRSFVEIISNIHYFQSSSRVIEVFSKIKDSLSIDIIYDVIDNFKFIYPYFQLAGYYLERIGYSKDELLKFHSKKQNLKFYTEKNKDNYSFDSYWNIFY
ncbi:hypothetical protein CRU96_06890 [Malaciobacter halophilus]|nr:hypothetical protein [Malaciobacter halophilus]RYA23600.1 hypothetical protein CRU96_06890 [Malaciobacter halophilus]